ncbi:hypothetical protein JW977_00145 [Candidatus Falkowbacteria bacterium]|nr:hypothetical protein [Candidatus Falkowbacteria bacterium]
MKCKYLLIFLIALAVFTYLGWSYTYSDPDSFYHAKMAVLMSEKGPVFDSFSWTQFSTIKENYADHHFLYHLLLIPFIKVFDPLLGTKIAGIFFSSLAIVFIYWFLKEQNIKYPEFFTLVTLFISSFLFRLGLAKAQPLSIILLILCLYFIFEKKYLWLFISSFIYVWTHGSFPLILVVWLVYFVSLFIANKYSQKPQLKNEIINSMKTGISCFFGIVAGLIINPYFPKNLYFYYEQIYKIAVVGASEIVRVGGEWTPYDIFSLITNSGLAFLLLIVSLATLFICFKKLNQKNWTLFLLTIIFLALALRSKRNVDYFIPMTVIFSAFSINTFFKTGEAKDFIKILKEQGKRKIVKFIYAIIIIGFVFIGARDLYVTGKSLHGGFSFDHYKQASEWLKNNTEQGETVFHSDWDDFGFLFYHNDHNYYIIGLDPTFLYDFDKDLYQEYDDITLGEKKEGLYESIKNTFKASYVFVEKEKEEFLENIKNSEGFEQIYEDEKAVIYKTM